MIRPQIEGAGARTGRVAPSEVEAIDREIALHAPALQRVLYDRLTYAR